MSFEIHTPEGRVIPLKELDKEASEFWKVPLDPDPKFYAHPDLPTFYTNSWYESIGWSIGNPEKHTGWEAVKYKLWQMQIEHMYKHLFDVNFHAQIEQVKTFLKPYFELIDHWESKGYIPIKID
jgi:hypothetical protein